MQTSDPKPPARHGSLSPWLLVGACLLVVLLAMLLPRAQDFAKDRPTVPSSPSGLGSGAKPSSSLTPRPAGERPSAPPEQIVAARLAQFAGSRYSITQAMAKKHKLAMSPELEQFFALAKAGKWDELKTAFAALKARRDTEEGKDLRELWGPIMETYGVAEVAHTWPAQKLLDYGQGVLDSLRPGMVYVGGTDAGRFIPTLLNETSEGEHHVILTQNALADGSYVQYLGFLYGDKLPTLTPDDSQRAFSDYLADAQKRLLHDQQFPDEPKQLRPGEDVRVTDGRVQVSGQVAVMNINEKLLQMFLAKNPDASFALEESFPFPSLQGAAVPLGPIMELRAPDANGSSYGPYAAQAVDYWRSAAQQLVSDPEAPLDSDVRNSYAKMAASQAGLLASHNSNAEAEQLYGLALNMNPSSSEAVFSYVNLLLGEKKPDEALGVAQRAVNAAPANNQFRSLLDQLKTKHP